MAPIPNLKGIFSGTYLGVISEIEVALCCVLVYTCKNVGFICHLACWVCELHWECCSHICLVIYVKYHYSMLNGWCQCFHMGHKHVCLPIYKCQVFGICGTYAKIGRHIVSGTYLTITGEAETALGVLWLVYVKYWVHIKCSNCIGNVAAMFVQ